MVRKRRYPPFITAVGTAYKHIVAAVSVLVAWFSGTVTGRPTLKRIWHGLVGRRQDLSITAVMITPVAAVVTGALVAATHGYKYIEQWVVGTVTLTDLHVVGVIGLVVFVGVATAFAHRNSGLIPTTVLVLGPIFGIGLGRYGMLIRHFSPSKIHRLFGATAMNFETVGALQTLGTALFLALLFGIPIGMLGFVLGTASRRIADLFGRRRGGNASMEV